MGTDPDWEIRLAAFRRLEELVARHGPVLPWNEISKGFPWRSERVLFASSPRGIFRPRQMSGGALSIKTVVPKDGKPRYNDLATDDGFLYQMQGSDPNDYDNQQLQESARVRAPLVYFYGIEPRWYRPIWPVFVSPERGAGAFRVLTTGEGLHEPGTVLADPLMQKVERRYATIEAKRRLHQDAFRHMVLAAYQRRCAVCTLSPLQLLDAAHIVPDRDPRGAPTVENGLALCRLHHAAYDANLLGIRPDCTVSLSRTLLAESDGPTLEYALKGYDGAPLHVPRRKKDRPNTDLLEQRYAEFLRAG